MPPVWLPPDAPLPPPPDWLPPVWLLELLAFDGEVADGTL